MPSLSSTFLKAHAVLVSSLLFVAGCAAPVVEYPVPARRVKDQSTSYQEVAFEGQVSTQTQKELQERYPEGFYKEQEIDVPLDQQVRVTFHLFTSNPDRPDIAKMVTDTFVNEFTQSKMFNVIEREQSALMTSELELNQSGLVNQDNAPDTGEFTATDVIITGSVDQAGGNVIQARVLDVASSRVVLSERITPRAVNRQSAEMLARMMLTRMKEHFYLSK